MATLNPFDLLGDDDTEDPTQLIAKLAPVIAAAKVSPPAVGKKGSAQPLKEPAVKLPSKPLPPSQAVREARGDAPRGGRGGFRGGSRGRGGGRGFNREFNENENSFGNSNGNTGGYRGSQEGEAGKTQDRYGSGPRDGFRGGRRGGFTNGDTPEGDGFRGGRRGGFNNGDAAEGERPRRTYERRSGTGRENNFKREGAGRGNWGTPADEITQEAKEPAAEVEKVVDSEKPTGQEETEVVEKDVIAKESEVKEPEEDKEMTLEEYEKVMEEKRKTLLALKPEERKVNLDKEFESMQLLDNKKNDEDVSAKLGSEKDKRKDAMEKAKKSLSINEFLKPAEGDAYYRPGGRGRGRGQGRGGGNHYSNVKAPSIEDVSQFPSLGGK